MSPQEGNLGRWPVLDHARLGATVEHLRRLTQVGGKYTLTELFEPGWGNIVFDVTPRGLRTPTLHQHGRTFEVHFRLLDGDVAIESDTGTRTLKLREGSVAGFYHEFLDAAHKLGLPPPGSAAACEIPGETRLDLDVQMRPWDNDAAFSIWSALSTASEALTRWQAPFRGHRPRVGVMWGAFDLSSTRYRGQYADAPADRPAFLQHGMTEEYVSVGFAFGTDDAPNAGMYAYVAPQPDGFDIWSDWGGVEGTSWDEASGLALLPWRELAGAADPVAAIISFGDAIYRSAVELAHWPSELVMARFDGWHASSTPPDSSHRLPAHGQPATTDAAGRGQA